MQEIKTKALAIIDKYKERLESKGIKIVLSKRYVETKVEERSGGYAYAGQAIFNVIDRVNNRKKEKEKGYNFERNKYHSLVIAVIPLDKSLVSITDCREYAFVLKKVERAHIGQEPQKKSYQEEKVLAKIEKRILKILKNADESSAKEICKNTFWDACRYAHSPKYGYKTKFCGKERFNWDIIFMFLAVAVVVAIILVAWAITKLL